MSHRNYYEVLEIVKTCTNEDITNSYRRLALKYHPKRNNPKDYAVNNFYFHQLAEAYSVLINPTLRGVYDVYGYEGVRHGVVDKGGVKNGGFIYNGNAEKIFETFFGCFNPFVLIKDFDRVDEEYGTIFGSAFGGQFDPAKVVLEDIRTTMNCSLEELYNGCVKVHPYKRQVINGDGRTTSIIDTKLEIEVKRGYNKNTVLKFAGKGNESPETYPSDLIVQINETPHSRFLRTEDDLVYVQTVSLVDAINNEPVIIKTLDNRTLNITIDEIVNPQTVKTLKGEGMPIHEDSRRVLDAIKKGNLYIHFNIIFPKFIEPSDKEQLVNILNNLA